MNKKNIIGSLVGSSSVLAVGLLILFVLLGIINNCGPGCSGGIGTFVGMVTIFFASLTILVFISLLFVVNKHSKQNFPSLSKFIIDECIWVIPISLGLAVFGFLSETKGQVGLPELFLLLAPIISGVLAATLCWFVVKPHNKRLWCQ